MTGWHRHAAATLRRLWQRPGRTADIHMWHLDAVATSRVQAFRDERGHGLALITLRDGDRGASHVNAAEAYRRTIWAEFFGKHTAPPTLIFNLLNPRLRYKGWPNVVAIDYDTQGRFAHCREVDAEELATLHRLGAQWDHGGGYVPYTPPPPTHAGVLRRIPVRELPGSQPFRDMGRYLAVDWAAASIAALQGSSEHDLPADLPADIAEAARSLWWDPISLIREPGEPLRFMNGQHRAEAMRQQGAVETIVEELRPVDARPLPGELQTISEC